MTPRPVPDPASPPPGGSGRVPARRRVRGAWALALLAGLGILVVALLAGGRGSAAEVTSSQRWTLLGGLWFAGLAVWALSLPAARALLVVVAGLLALTTLSGLGAGGPFPATVVQLFGIPLLAGVGLIGVLAVPPAAGGHHRPLPGLLRGAGLALAVVVVVLAVVAVLGTAGA